MMSAIKTGAISHSKFDHLATLEARKYGQKMERSGGGL